VKPKTEFVVRTATSDSAIAKFDTLFLASRFADKRHRDFGASYYVEQVTRVYETE
jgi:hypothetical protein